MSFQRVSSLTPKGQARGFFALSGEGEVSYDGTG